MKKYELKLKVNRHIKLGEKHFLLILQLSGNVSFSDFCPGQFVQIKVEGSPETFLRRPISINYIDTERHELWLLVQQKGEGTRHLAELKAGDSIDVIFPLGRGFTMPKRGEKTLLIGGGVGVAPLLYLGKKLLEQGDEPAFLLGARSSLDLLEYDEFERLGQTFVTTEDGSQGEKGFVTQHSILNMEHFDHLKVCGPSPMMKAVAQFAHRENIDCEVSLENMMACGLGACLCCVEKTVRGNLCVCTEGPVFNINELLWPI
jgi:dihydroorotate dehydrogenase electron transfer subunit